MVTFYFVTISRVCFTVNTMTTHSKDIQVRRRPEQERSKDTVHTILAAAKVLFGEHGIDTVSMTQIAKQAALSKPALYRYFPNKQAMVRELAEQDFAEAEALIRRHMSSASSSLHVAMVKAITEYCRLHTQQPYRIKLRAAIQADPVLAELDLIDSRKNAQLLVDFVSSTLPGVDKPSIARRALLVSELLESLVRLVSRVNANEGKALIEEFVQRFSFDLAA